MLIVDYLTTSQSEECPQADLEPHNPPHSPYLLEPSESQWVVWALVAWTPCLALTVTAALSTTTSSSTALAPTDKWTQVWLGNRTSTGQILIFPSLPHP